MSDAKNTPVSKTGLIDQKTFVDLYKTMLRIRIAEERVAQIYPSDKIQSPIHLCIGQEAISTGVCRALDADDHIYGTYRGHGIYLAKGGGLKELFAELYAKDSGCCRGKGGSMHMVAPEVGLMGCSAIVASTVPVATGAALASQLHGRKRVVVAIFGDGAIDEGVLFESLNFAALKDLPILFVCENNNYAVHSRFSDRHKIEGIYRYGEAFGVKGKRFDGNDVATVYRTMVESIESVRKGGGPLLLEYSTYRWYEHVGPGQDHKAPYRDLPKLAEGLANDPIAKAERVLREQYEISDDEIGKWKKPIQAEVDDAVAFAEKSPFPEARELLTGVFKERERPLIAPKRPTSVITYGRALHDALESAMSKDPSVFVMGIGVDDHKGTFGSTMGLVDRFGKARVFDTPIAEAGMTGVAIGAAIEGMRPVHIHIRADFLYLAMDQLCNIAAKWRYMFGGRMSVPIVVRAVIGRSWGQGSQHSQSLQSLFMHIPGLKVVMPTTAYDAKGYLAAAISEPNPVVMIEHRLLYDIPGEVPSADYELPFGKAYVRRQGRDLTLVANSYMVVEALKAAEFLATQNIEVEIVDPVSLSPIDEETICASVQKTGRLLVCDQSWTACGASAEIAALVAEKAFEDLKQPIRRLGNQPAPCPVAKTLENAFYPNARTIAWTVCEMMGRKVPDAEIPLLSHKFKGPF